MEPRNKIKFGVLVEKTWGLSIGLALSATPKDMDGKREVYLWMNFIFWSVTIGFIRVYDGEPPYED